MKNKILGLVILMTMILVVTGCQKPVAQEIGSDEVAKTVVETAPIIEDQVEAFYMSFGEVTPQNQVDIMVTGNGEIESILVKSGDVVKAETPLIKLSTDQVQINYSAQESQFRTIRDNLKVQLDAAQDNYQKQLELYNNGFASQASIDTLKTQLATLEKQYLDANNNYNNQVKSLKNAVNDRLLTSTIDGEVAAIYVKEGQKISNQKAISIINRDSIFVKTMVTSSLLKNLEIGTPAVVHLSGNADNLINGEIVNIDLLPNPQNKLYQVEVKLENPDDSIYIGDFVEVKFVYDEHLATLVPNAAILYEGSKTFIFILDQNEAKKVPVVLGLTKDENVEITSTVDLRGKQIIVKGQNYIQDGERVALKN